MRPAHVEGVISSKGTDGAHLEWRFPQIVSTAPHLNVSAFCTGLDNALKNSVAGFVMCLRKNGATICTLQRNWAHTPSDGSLAWNPDRQMHVASVSKLITGMAMTKLLDEKNISYDAKIIDYLPTYWQKGPNIDKITFRHLLTHKSGFSTNSSNSDFPFMKSKVAAGVSGVGGYDYENMNFGLCRILIPVINGTIAKNAPLPPNLVDQAWDFLTINAYAQYVQQKVFAPSGVAGATLMHPNGDALAYSFPVSGPGWNSGDLSTMAGGAGWHLSVNQLLAVMGTFRRGGTIMSAPKAQAMLDNGFGIDVVGMNTPAGKLYNKNGAWGSADGRQEQSLAYFLPEGMELAVFANSPVGSPAQFFRGVVTQVYLDHIQ
jgi:CubicO group peptidase (beta-lactamase class C family)